MGSLYLCCKVFDPKPKKEYKTHNETITLHRPEYPDLDELNKSFDSYESDDEQNDKIHDMPEMYQNQ